MSPAFAAVLLTAALGLALCWAVGKLVDQYRWHRWSVRRWPWCPWCGSRGHCAARRGKHRRA